MPLNSVANQKRFGGMNGVGMLLQAVALFKSKDPKTGDEEEMVENLFDCLCCVFMPLENKERFVKAEGVELMIIILDEPLAKEEVEELVKVLGNPADMERGLPEKKMYLVDISSNFNPFKHFSNLGRYIHPSLKWRRPSASLLSPRTNHPCSLPAIPVGSCSDTICNA